MQKCAQPLEGACSSFVARRVCPKFLLDMKASVHFVLSALSSSQWFTGPNVRLHLKSLQTPRACCLQTRSSGHRKRKLDRMPFLLCIMWCAVLLRQHQSASFTMAVPIALATQPHHCSSSDSAAVHLDGNNKQAIGPT